MDTITIPQLNERAYSAIVQRFGDLSRKLHGVLAPCPKAGLLQVLWPFGEMLTTLKSLDPSRCDEVFYKGSFSLHNYLQCYLRSCQLLGLALPRLEQKMENDHRELNAHKGGGSWSVEIDLEAPCGMFHYSVDVAIYLDSCVSYLKILADGVAKTIPSVFGAPPFSVSRDSMNTLWNNALRRAGSPLERVFRSTPRTWLDILSAPRSEIAGIRDARFHHGAYNVPVGHAKGDEPIGLVIQQASVGEERLGFHPGKTFRASGKNELFGMGIAAL